MSDSNVSTVSAGHKVIAVAHNKGGVGKTTTALALASIYSARGMRVLVVDLDAQSNATITLLKERPEESIYDAMVGGKPIPVFESRSYENGGKLDVVPSSLQLAWVDLNLSSAIAREQILKDVLAPVVDSYDYVFLDCPPSLSLMTQNAFVAATDVLIPLNADRFSVEGLMMILSFFTMIQRRLNPGLRLAGMVITQFERNTLSKSIAEVLEKQYSECLFHSYIRKNVAVGKAQSLNVDLAEFDSRAAAYQDYLKLADEILESFGKDRP